MCWFDLVETGLKHPGSLWPPLYQLSGKPGAEEIFGTEGKARNFN